MARKKGKLMTKQQRLRFTSGLISRIALNATQGDKDAAFRNIFYGFTRLGGVYVKFLQILSARYEFRNITSVSVKDRADVFDAVETEDLDIHAILSTELGPGYSQQFKSVSKEPFAAGSFGQVYYGVHNDGTPIIIKVLRPSLLRNLKFDLKVLKVILRLIDASPFARSFDSREVFKEFKSVVIEETDYPKETANAQYFYDYFIDHPTVVIPKSYPELSTRHILTQEYLDGIPLTELLVMHEGGGDIVKHVKQQTGSDLRHQLYVLGHELLYSTLAADKIPGDPHAGNIKVMTGNRLGLFDFGITADPPENRMAFKDIIKEFQLIYAGDFNAGRVFVGGMRFFANRLYRAINTVAVAVKNQDPDFDLVTELQGTADKVFKQNERRVDVEAMIKNGTIGPIFRQTLNEGNRFALNIEMDGIVMIKAADTYMALLNQLGMKVDLVPSIFESVIQRIDSAEGAQIEGKSDMMDLEAAIEIVSSWLQELIERDPLAFHGFVSKLRQGMNQT